jgi:hypothetical protein
MAWRPSEYLIEGELNNTTPGRVTGWLRFAGLTQKAILDLDGDFHRDIRGTTVRLKGNESPDAQQAEKYMQGFSAEQVGTVGDITAGFEPQDYVRYPYFEWYSEANGRVVLELEPYQVDVIGKRVPPENAEPISRDAQARRMANFLSQLATGRARAETASPPCNPKGMQLLTKEIRKKLPPLGAQDGLGGKAVAYLKLFTPTAGWTWYATEYDGDDTFFGLVDGFVKELGYFSLAELRSVKGPLGLPIERDRYFTPTPLEDIAPELFAAKRSASTQ